MINRLQAVPVGAAACGRLYVDFLRSVIALFALAAVPTIAFAAAPIAGDDTGIARSGPGAGEQVSIDVALNDSDPDGDPLSYVVASGEFLGTATVSEAGVVTYTAPLEFNGTDVIGILVSDGLNEVISSLSITVVADIPPTAVNDSASTSSTQVPANSAIQIAVLANDSDGDGDVLSYNDVVIAQQPANGSVTQSCVGACLPPEYQPNAGFSGTDTFTYFVRDALGASSNTATVTVNVTAANSPPTAVDDSYSVLSAIDSGGSSVLNVLGNDSDVDGDPLTVTAVTQAANGSVTLQNGSVTFRPQTNFRGVTTFTYTVWDGVAGDPQNFVTATVTVTVQNRPPNSQSPTASTVAGRTVGFAAISTEPDPEFDTVSVTSFNQPSNGSVIASGSTGFEYTPNPGFTGVDTFSFVISDSFGATAGSLATVTVTANTPPTLGADTASTRSGPTTGLQVDIDSTLNDSDPDGDPLSYNQGTAPANGSVIVSPTGLLRYTPNAGFVGIDTFTYTASDGTNPDVVGNVSVTVVADVAPVAVDDTATTATTQVPANSAIQILVLDNDSDGDGDVLSYNDLVIVQQPANGSVTRSCAGNCNPPVYQPNAGFSGTDTFTYRAVDALGAQSNIATVSITVTSTNSPPVVAGETATARSGPVAGEQISIDATLNDSDVDGDALTYTLSGGSFNGTVTVSPTGLIRYTPPAGYTGSDVFSYSVSDGVNEPAFANVSVTVVADVPPVAVDDVAATTSSPSPAASAIQIPVLANDSDGDGDVLAYRDLIIVQQPANGSVTQSCLGACSPPEYQPNSGFSGTDTFTYRAVDALGGQSNIATVTITVSAQNLAPTAIIAGGNRSVADTDGSPGEVVAMSGSGSSDSDGTIASYEWTVGGQIVATATGPSPNLTLQDGANVVGLTVVDNSGARSTAATVTITVGIPVIAPVVTIRVGSTSIPDSDGQPGENVPFEGSATDADGTVAVSTFRWFVNDEPVASADGQASPVLALLNGSNTVILLVTDNSGNDGSETLVVTVGEAGVLTDLPGVQGDDNLESTAAATETTCSTLLKADPAALTPEQLNLRATCDTIFANVETNADAVVDALQQIGGQQVTAQQSTAIDYTSAQMLNVSGRLTALRQGARGFSSAGLNLGGPTGGIPLNALASLGKSLFGEGGSSGDEEGGLLDDRLGIFLNGSVRFGDKDATSRESGFGFDTLGITAGADYRFTDALVAGFALGYGTASADFDARGGSQDSDSYSGSLYGSWYGQNVYFDGIASLGSVSYDSIRNINLFDGAIVDQAIGQTDGMQLALGVSSGYDFGEGAFRFGPNVALNYIKVDIDGFRERTTGTSGLAMAFGDQTADSLTMKVGGHFNYSLSRKWGVLSPQARFDIVREFANESERVSVRYANDPIVTAPGQAGGTFVIFTDNPDEYYFLWAVGLAAQFVSGFSGFVDYEQTEALDTITSGELSFGVRYQTQFR